MSECAIPTPKLRMTVELAESRFWREVSNFTLNNWANKLLASPKLPSAFSKSIRLILYGITDEPKLRQPQVFVENN